MDELLSFEPFEADLWVWTSASASASWHFITAPVELAGQVRSMAGRPAAGPGFGTIRVRATIGSVSWATSLFPDKVSGSFFLPVKQAVRKRAAILSGDRVTVTLALVL